MLKRYYRDWDYIIKWDTVLLDNDLSYEQEQVVILDRDIQKLRMKEIYFVKVQLKHHQIKVSTWETKKDMWDKYPQLFEDTITLYIPLLNYFLYFIIWGSIMAKLVSVVMTIIVIMYKPLIENPMIKFNPNLKLKILG